MSRGTAFLWLFVGLTLIAPGLYVVLTASGTWSATETMRVVVGAIGLVLTAYFGYRLVKRG